MRFSFLLALTVVLSLAGVQWYQTTQYICPVPISYRLGEIDSSFTLSEVEAKQYIEEATAVWEDVAAQDLFIYNDDAAFTINFIFDERQAMADAQIFDRDRLDSIAEQNEAFRTQIADIQSSYQRRQTTFNAEREAYDSRLQSYNDKVRQANDRGGATPAVFTELELERVSLASESEELRVEADALNNLAQQLNELSTEGNRLVETYNQEVRTYNADYGATHEFTQGDYRGGEINIYKFSNQYELVSVLAHEFGHSLGIDHIEEPGSLMYYLLDDELDSMPTLTDSDIAAYQIECADQGFSARVRGFIREALAKL